MVNGPTCAKCGFLALRNLFTGDLDEAPDKYRVDGVIPEIRTHVKRSQSINDFYDYPYDGVPICFKRADNLIDEVVWRGSPGVVVPEAVKAIVDKERTCNDQTFTEWQQGFTPKEHREMLDRQWLLERQEAREDADRAWRAVQEAKADKRYKWNLVITAGLVTIVSAIIQILSAFIQRGSLP